MANFVISRHFVFRDHAHTGLAAAALRYFSLVVTILAVNYALLHLLHERWGVSLLAAKLLTEVGLFVLGFFVQKRVVFARHRTGHVAAPPIPTD